MWKSKSLQKPILALFLLCSFPLGALAQSLISGTVKDVAGEPIIGASVVVQGSKMGVVTDLDGRFEIKAADDATLTVSFIGYTTETVKVGGRNNLTVILKEDAQVLNDVVVIGYGVQKKSDLTGSVASVNSDDIKNLSATNAAAALQGKAAGVQILNTSGAPGTESKIRVRGYSSNSENIGPLLIVDGLKVDNISYLDPSMIESMEILKDAASAAIYGAEAGNGVVLITTKSGSKGHSSINYSFKLTNQSLGKKAELFEGNEYVAYQKAIGNITDDILTANNYVPGTSYNWFDAVFEPSWSQQHSLSFQGGNDRGSFFASLNYLKNDGIVVGDKDVYKRLTAQINADYKIFDWLTIGTSNSFERYRRTSVTEASYGSMLNSVMSIDPLTPAYYSTIEECATAMQQHYQMGDPVLRDPNHNNDFYATSKYLEEATGNPLIQRDRQDSESKGLILRGTTYLNFAPIKGFVFTSRIGYRVLQSNTHSYSTPFWATGMANSTDYNISADVNTGYYYQWENFANYNITIAKKHNLGAMVGMSYIEDNWDNAAESSRGTDILKDYAPNFRYINYLKSDAVKNMTNNLGSSSSISYFGRLSYSYDDRYSVQVNFRADAFDSSKLAKKNRWGYFPSFSAGWTVSNEKFFQDNVSSKAVSFLKLRGSWGRNGNVNVLKDYPYVATVKLNDQWYQYDPTAGEGSLSFGSGPTTLANPDLKWETAEQIDLGLDARFLDNRLSFGFDWYRKETKDLLVKINPIPEIGVKEAYTNAGNVLNSGFEFELGWKDRIGDFQYSVKGNLATVHNKVLALHNTIDRIEGTVGGIQGLNNKIRTAFEVGQPIWYFRGYKYAGVNQETGAPQYYNANGEVVETVMDNDLQYIGKAIPDFTYGITVNLAYKGFDFSLFGTGSAGNDIFSLLYSADRSKTNCLKHYWENSWTEDNHQAKYPKAATVANDWYFWSSSASLFNGSYFKFKQIQLGYTIPANITKKVKISSLRVFASLDDFFTISSYPGCDPETATTGQYNGMGYDAGTYPTTKKAIFGINITF
jgi:TonB-linked SusC/RagA family outer membrane protein